MIKIIKNTMEEPTAITCEHCKSELEYTYQDIQRKERYNIFGFSQVTDRFLICPVCKNEIDLDSMCKLEEAVKDD